MKWKMERVPVSIEDRERKAIIKWRAELIQIFGYEILPIWMQWIFETIRRKWISLLFPYVYPDSIGIPGLISIFSVPWIISNWKIGYFLPFSPIYRRSAIFMEKEPLFASVSFARNRISSGRNCESVRALNFGRRRLRESLFPSRDRWLTRLSWSGRSLLKDEIQFFPHFPPSDNKKCTSNRSCYFLPALQRSENFSFSSRDFHSPFPVLEGSRREKNIQSFGPSKN